MYFILAKTIKFIIKKTKIKLWLILLLCLFNLSLQAQNPNQTIYGENINQKYLEHLIKVKVDSVRLAHNCDILVNDSILYIAANHHANYMLKRNKLTHFEKEFKDRKTPQLRVEYFGGFNYFVGENALQTFFGSIIKKKNGTLSNTNTYEGLSNSIVDGWVKSPGHYKNMITTKYQLTGVSVAFDNKTKKLYACQKFAFKENQYSFTESKSFFEYSNFIPPEPITSFSQISNQLHDKVHDWGLRHDKLNKCKHCISEFRNKPFITMDYANGFILKIENSEFVKNIIRNKNDGFAVEVVEFNDFRCGNPTYYLKPSIRNGQCKFNGTLTEPLYRKQLYKGYKERAKKEEIKFLSYILNADSVPFFKRFRRYKMAKFSSKYFEINLGHPPPSISGLWASNLVYIQDNQICHIDYFTSRCCGLYSDFRKLDFFSLPANGNYSFNLEKDTLHYKIPYEKSKYKFTNDDIAPLITLLSGIGHNLDSIRILAYSSIEGKPGKNKKLQIKRANSIADAIKTDQLQNIKINIETRNNWEHFRKAIKSNEKWHFLSKLKTKELLKQVNKKYSDSLEFILKQERFTKVNIYCTGDVNETNLKHYISKEFKQYSDSLKKYGSVELIRSRCLSKLDSLYGFTHKMVMEGKIDIQFIANLRMPRYFNYSIPLTEKFVMYGYQFYKYFRKKSFWVDNNRKLSTSLFEADTTSLSTEFIYNDCRLKIDKIIKKEIVKQKEVQAIIDEMEFLDEFYFSSKEAAHNIDKMTFNLNFVLLNKVFIEDTKKYAVDAEFCISQILDFYKKNNLINSSLAFKLAKIAVFYENSCLAQTILVPYLDNQQILEYSLQLGYHHPSENNEMYYNKLIELSNQMDTDVWCNMFIGNCKIPFQAFDHERLRNTFCKKCMKSNKFIKSMKN